MAIPIIKHVRIDFIEHADQRYPTVGDWFYGEETLYIRVSKMSDVRYMALVAIHELTETLICGQQSITQEQVDEFDMNFEAQREEGNLEEPGRDQTAPYYDAHQFAERQEKELAEKLEVDWNTYENEVNSL